MRTIRELFRDSVAWRLGTHLQAQRHFERATCRKRKGRADSLGLCIVCVLNRPAEGMRTCQECLARRRGYELERETHLIGAGCCKRCGRPRERLELKHCDACLARRRGDNAKARATA